MAKESGIALVLTLLVITILCVMVVEFNYLMRVDISIAANIRDENRAFYIAKAGVNAAIAILRKDDNNFDAPSEDWGKFAELTRIPSIYSEYLGEGNITVGIADKSGKINVNKITDENSVRSEQLRKLIDLLEIDAESIEGIVDSIIDWVDPNDDPQPMGAEDDFYQGTEDPYPCRDAPLETVSELLMVKGITEDIFYGTKEKEGIKDFLTVHSKGKININTADPLVLQTLCYWKEADDEWSFPITKEIAENIVEIRGEEVFEKESDLKEKVDDISEEIYKKIHNQITVSTKFFSIDAVGEVNMAEKRISAIISRGPERRGEGRVMKVVYWAVE